LVVTCFGGRITVVKQDGFIGFKESEAHIIALIAPAPQA
jgi:hypothetical protein